MFDNFTGILKPLCTKYCNAHLIIAGDFNEAPDDYIDRYPPRLNYNSVNSCVITFLCKELSVTDAWRFYNPNLEEFTWSNKSMTARSRIDLFLISHSLLHNVKNVFHQFAPLTDHKIIFLDLQQGKPCGTRGYWKFNNSLLKDTPFNESVVKLI